MRLQTSTVDALIGQGRHDLPWRQCREIALVAGEQDPLAFLLAQSVRNQALAAFTAIDAVPSTNKLSPPGLQGGEPHTQQISHHSSPGPSRIEDLRGLAAFRCGNY